MCSAEPLWNFSVRVRIQEPLFSSSWAQKSRKSPRGVPSSFPNAKNFVNLRNLTYKRWILSHVDLHRTRSYQRAGIGQHWLELATLKSGLGISWDSSYLNCYWFGLAIKGPLSFIMPWAGCFFFHCKSSFLIKFLGFFCFIWLFFFVKSSISHCKSFYLCFPSIIFGCKCWNGRTFTFRG